MSHLVLGVYHLAWVMWCWDSASSNATRSTPFTTHFTRIYLTRNREIEGIEKLISSVGSNSGTRGAGTFIAAMALPRRNSPFIHTLSAFCRSQSATRWWSYRHSAWRHWLTPSHLTLSIVVSELWPEAISHCHTTLSSQAGARHVRTPNSQGKQSSIMSAKMHGSHTAISLKVLFYKRHKSRALRVWLSIYPVGTSFA